tara:strand:- start:1479 stop:2207 length:729 start_codon:yes stop_codon:yes gene_type:complete
MAKEIKNHTPITISAWNEYWVNKKFKPIIENPPQVAYGGTNIEPLASIGMSYFLEPCREKFKDGFVVLDYGAGAGILCNFISERLEDFKYYGLEPYSEHGIERISLGKDIFKDSRVTFGYIEKDLNLVLSESPDCIVLISVFTHLELDDITKILNNLIKVFDYNPNCDIVFSCFLADKEYAVHPQPDIWKNFYGQSFIQESSIQNYCSLNNLELTKCPFFIADGGHKHEIFKINKKEKTKNG